jgi:diketogulonate reductase-like aldo/keto reductase
VPPPQVEVQPYFRNNALIQFCKEQGVHMTYRPVLHLCPLVEVHPYFRNDALIHFCAEQDIHVSAYSPLGTPGATEFRQ